MLIDAFTYEAAPYFLHYPFMAHDVGGELDGNAILYAGTYALLRFKLFGKYEDAARHAQALYDLSVLPDQPGVITRGPHKWDDPQTHDDYMGLATLSFIGDSAGRPAQAIYEHGRGHWWSFVRNGHGNLKEWFNAQFWRLPGVSQHLTACVSESWGPLDRLLWAISVYANSYARAGDTSGTILKWHMVSVYEMGRSRNWLCDWAAKKWKESLLARYPNAMGDVFRIYYGPAHLFARWAVGVI